MYGAVAQLGERLNGIQEVRGSNPLSSTFFYTRQAGWYRGVILRPFGTGDFLLLNYLPFASFWLQYRHTLVQTLQGKSENLSKTHKR